uniref:Uncharacterized protein n=1 Tax=Anguilla anguilla TaxID=7936 RepID=A0A0E9UM72_ANGAN
MWSAVYVALKARIYNVFYPEDNVEGDVVRSL